MNDRHSIAEGVSWRRVSAFLGLTFTVSWGGNFLFWVTGAYQTHRANLLEILSAQMWVPAGCAIALQLFVFKDSPLYHRNLRGTPRRFFLFFVFSAALSIAMALSSAFSTTAAAAIPLVSAALHILLLVILLRSQSTSSSDELARTGLNFGPRRYWLWFVLAYLLFMAVQFLLLLKTQGGVLQSLDSEEHGEGSGILILISSLLVSPILSLVGSGFGEEYGWRGYLQGELVELGNRRGIALVGLIWAVWHYPILLLGLHAYPATATGLVLMTILCVLLAFVLGYARIKTGSVWLASYLHVLGNVLVLTMLTAVPPHDIVVSWGIGVPGLVCLAVVVAWILRDPLWRHAR